MTGVENMAEQRSSSFLTDNMFSAGSLIRLYILGTPLDQIPLLPRINTMILGGASGSQLVLPGLASPQF